MLLDFRSSLWNHINRNYERCFSLLQQFFQFNCISLEYSYAMNFPHASCFWYSRLLMNVNVSVRHISLVWGSDVLLLADARPVHPHATVQTFSADRGQTAVRQKRQWVTLTSSHCPCQHEYLGSCSGGSGSAYLHEDHHLIDDIHLAASPTRFISAYLSSL